MGRIREKGIAIFSFSQSPALVEPSLSLAGVSAFRVIDCSGAFSVPDAHANRVRSMAERIVVCSLWMRTSTVYWRDGGSKQLRVHRCAERLHGNQGVRLDDRRVQIAPVS